MNGPKGIAFPLGMMSGMMNDEDESPDMPLQEQLLLLKETQERFNMRATDRFKPGDLVTPAVDSDMKMKGYPHLVLEVLEEGIDIGDKMPPYSSGWYSKVDLHFVCVSGGGQVSQFWAEHWKFKLWTPDMYPDGDGGTELLIDANQPTNQVIEQMAKALETLSAGGQPDIVQQARDLAKRLEFGVGEEHDLFRESTQMTQALAQILNQYADDGHAFYKSGGVWGFHMKSWKEN